MKALILTMHFIMNFYPFIGYTQPSAEYLNLNEDLFKILPLLKSNVDSADIYKTISITAKHKPIIDKLVADIVILFAIDRGTNLEIISEKKLSVLHLSKTELKELAISNLNKLVKNAEIKMHGDTSFALITFDGNHEATLILMNEFWNNIESLYKDNEFLVALPSKDVLLIASIRSETGINQMKDAIINIFRNDDHNLSRWIFRYKNQTLDPFLKVNE